MWWQSPLISSFHLSRSRPNDQYKAFWIIINVHLGCCGQLFSYLPSAPEEFAFEDLVDPPKQMSTEKSPTTVKGQVKNWNPRCDSIHRFRSRNESCFQALLPLHGRVDTEQLFFRRNCLPCRLAFNMRTRRREFHAILRTCFCLQFCPAACSCPQMRTARLS